MVNGRGLFAQPGLAIILLVAAALFSLALGGDFVRDDWPVIVDNSKLRDWAQLPRFFVSSVWGSTDWDRNNQFLYRPLFFVVVFLNYQAWGLDPFGYHLFNLALYLLCLVLLYRLLRRGFGGSPAPAFWGTLVFAVHPVHVESVAWISGATDLLLACFALACLLAYQAGRDARAEGRAAGLRLGACAALYALALLAKEVAVVLPVVMLGWDLARHRRPLWPLYAALGGVLLAYLLVRQQVLGDLSVQRFDLQQWPRAVEFLFTYLQTLLVPWPLHPYQQDPMRSWGVAVGLAAVLALGAVALRSRAWRADAAFALLLFTATLAPALAIALMDSPWFASRFLFLPSVALAWLVAAWMHHPAAPAPPLRRGILAGWVVLAGVISVQQIGHWKDEAAFLRAAIAGEPDQPTLYVALARYYARTGRPAPVEILAALARSGTTPASRVNNLEAVAAHYGRQGDAGASRSLYRALIELAPDYSMAWVGLGNNAWAERRLDEARRHYERACELAPDNYEAHYNLSLVYQRLGQPAKARQFRARAQRLQTGR